MAHFNQAFTLPSGLSVIGGVIDFKITSHMKIPSGSSAQRLTNPENFSVRGNSETGLIEYYYNGRWLNLSPGDSGDDALLLTMIMT